MADAWTPLLNSLPLSRAERETIKRFREDASGRGFLPVADILRAHRLIDESLELLTQGLQQHPNFTVARVILVRELLGKGLVSESWQVLEQSPEPLRDNVLAQKLRLKLTLLIGDEAAAKATNQHLKLQQMQDLDSKKLGELLEVSGIAAAQAALFRDFSERGIELILPASAVANLASAEISAAVASPVHSGPTLGAASAYLSSDIFADESTLAAFHVVPLDEIFRPGDEPGARQGGSGGIGGIELDSTTLAEIYIRQHHYSRALEIYRRLLQQSPGSDALRTKMAELLRLDREQRDTDLTLDPGLVDVIESVEIINRQMRFYNELLSRLK